jgi:hypothetical protein
MARGKPIDIDFEAVHQLQAQGLSKAEIARQLHLPVSTLKDGLKRALPVKATSVHNGGSTEVHKRGTAEVHTSGATKVHIDIPVSDMVDLQELLAWWRKRKYLLNVANEAPAPTERWTLHIEKPFIERIKAEAEAEHVTVMEVINRIIRHYYAGS